MEKKRIIIADFSKSETCEASRALYQYDHGVILRIEGTDIQDSCEVHFETRIGNKGRAPADEAIVRLAEYSEADGLTVTIPQISLRAAQTRADFEIHAYLYYEGEGVGMTCYHCVIPVYARAIPADDIPDTEERSALQEAIEALKHMPTIAVTDTETGALISVKPYEGDVQEVAVNDGKDGADGATGPAGPSGADGISPTATVEQTSTGAKITVTDAIGITTADIKNGKDGAQGPTGATGPAGADGATGPAGPAGADGFSPTASVKQTATGATITVTDATGTTTADIKNGKDGAQGAQGPAGETGPQGPAGADGAQGPAGPAGADGFSPTASVTQTATGAKITITDANGTTTADIKNGADGATGPQGPAGADGISPTASVTQTATGATITVTDATGTTTANIVNGKDGAQGAQGPAGETGPQGPQGPKGDTGETGPAGATGPAGPAGADGATGPAGPAGADGAQGPAGPAGATGPAGPAGADGVSPTASVEQTSTGAKITITDATGTTTADIKNGADGATGPQGPAGADGATGPAGADGISPTASVTQTATGATITVTDASGTTTANIANGKDGAQGPQGPAGETGPQGPQGPKGDTGETGSQGEKGEKGDAGERGTGMLKVTTAPASYTTQTGGFTPKFRIALSTVKSQSGVDEVLVGDVLINSYNHYVVGYVDDDYVYLGAATSFRGAKGTTGSAGHAGADGAQGPAGPAGESAYEIAVRTGAYDAVTPDDFVEFATIGLTYADKDLCQSYVDRGDSFESTPSAEYEAGWKVIYPADTSPSASTTQYVLVVYTTPGKVGNEVRYNYVDNTKPYGIIAYDATKTKADYIKAAGIPVASEEDWIASLKGEKGDPGAVSDVKVNGTSVLTDGVADIPVLQYVHDGTAVGSVTEGLQTTASGESSHAEGTNTTASGNYSHAGGRGTIAQGIAQTVIGQYNVATGGATSAPADDFFIIGCGLKDTNRKNAHTVARNGIGWYLTDVKVGGTSKNDAPISLVSMTTALADKADKTTATASSDGLMSAQDKAKLDTVGSVVTVSGATPTVTALAGVRYVCGEVTTLDFTPCATGICDVIFSSGSTPAVVTLPDTVKFPDGTFTAEANKTYEINIMDGVYGVVMEWT